MATALPPEISTSPLRRLVFDVRNERAAEVPYPPGFTRFSMRRTQRFSRDPLPVMLEAYERFGPIFTIRLLHGAVVFMIGPEANHYVTVSGAKNFRWRDGSMGDLIPLLGDGLLTIDGEYHHRARRIMLPAFHRERIAASVQTMVDETELALADWRPGQTVDVYAWTRNLALRIAMRALFGFDPDKASDGMDAAHEFEEALSFWGTDYVFQMLRGPRTPWARMHAARRKLDALIFREIARRRANPDSAREDIMSLLLEARDEDGTGLSDQEIRDQVMTLMFAGHDTTTSTIAFLFHELAKNPHERELLQEELTGILGGAAPTPEQAATGLPRTEMAVDETLRIYPAAWIGARRAVETYEFNGVKVPRGAPVMYSSWASHHLRDVFPEPEAFRPDRFTPEGRAAMAKGAYVPFGGGSRTCIGMRFGLMEIRVIAAIVLQRFTLEHVAGYRMSIRQMPTISPRNGLPMTLRAAA